MDDDLNTPGVFALLFNLVRDGNRALDATDDAGAATALATVREIARAVGLELQRHRHRSPTRPWRLAASATRPAPPRTGPGPTPCATSSPTAATSSRTPPPAPRSAPPDPLF